MLLLRRRLDVTDVPVRSCDLLVRTASIVCGWHLGLVGSGGRQYHCCVVCSGSNHSFIRGLDLFLSLIQKRAFTMYCRVARCLSETVGFSRAFGVAADGGAVLGKA